MSLTRIIEECGLNVIRQEAVHGGDINRSYCLHTRTEKYFLKVNDAARYPLMFAKEAKGLQALQNQSTIRTPGVIRYGETDHDQYLLLEWIEKGHRHADSSEQFGRALAGLHSIPQSSFGWEEDNYIGSLVQVNTKHQSWHSFYTECRIMPLVKTLVDNGSFSQQDMRAAESFCKKLDQLFPSEPASLLHGDLWSGNYMTADNGNMAWFDPAVYYGHREMDIGMTLLFGGFDADFYQAYHEHYPLQSGWQQRAELTQLYPLLVHAVLFGGHYCGNAREIINRF
jgi:fructosamine-3-kinase